MGTGIPSFFMRKKVREGKIGNPCDSKVLLGRGGVRANPTILKKREKKHEKKAGRKAGNSRALL